MTLEESLKALKSAFTSKSGEAEAMAKEMGELKAKNDTLAAEYATVVEKLEASAVAIAERDAAISKVEELTKALAASEALKAEASKQIETVGKELRAMMPFLGAGKQKVADVSGG